MKAGTRIQNCRDCGKISNSRYCVFCQEKRAEQKAASSARLINQLQATSGKQQNEVMPDQVTEEKQRRPQFLSADELADMLRVRRTWVTSKARSGFIPSIKVGRYHRFHIDSPEFKAWLDSLKRNPAKP